MAVPKKRTSKTKSKSRLANWTHKANIQAKRALSLAKSVANGSSTSFVYSSKLQGSDNLTDE
uniref:Large ribosomal subunit protein bL32c n=1 Tax=Chroomonas mesostigmatica CCMP1168 TaxID=1195612 RepID=A0A248SPI7_9CRYP|nr:ribosomal protein L32 [Chroomonas mesostigmatica CCMP1168]